MSCVRMISLQLVRYISIYILQYMNSGVACSHFLSESWCILVGVQEPVPPLQGSDCVCVCVCIIITKVLTESTCMAESFMPMLLLQIYMWQSCVEIEGYSVAYFDCITALKAPYR